MKVVFIEGKYRKIISLPEDLIEKLPKRVALFNSVQFMNSQENIIKQLEESGRKAVLPITPHSKYRGQLLGCGIKKLGKFDGEFDAFLYVGDGVFHPQALVVENDKPVFCYDPFGDGYWNMLDRKTVDEKLRRKKGALSKFFASENIGVLVSTKPGQNYLNYALKLKDRYPGKKFYFILNNSVDFSQLEYFPFVECWVNTACPRIGIDDVYKFEKPVVNLDDVAEGLIKTSIAFKEDEKLLKSIGIKTGDRKKRVSKN